MKTITITLGRKKHLAALLRREELIAALRAFEELEKTAVVAGAAVLSLDCFQEMIAIVGKSMSRAGRSSEQKIVCHALDIGSAIGKLIAASICGATGTAQNRCH